MFSDDLAPRRRESIGKSRSGNVLVFTAFLMVVFMAILALSVDAGYMYLVRDQVQRTADAAAFAGASAIYVPPGMTANQVYSLSPDLSRARHEARDYVRRNPGAGRLLDANINTTNLPDGDIVLGQFRTPWDRTESLDLSSDMPNTVQVRVRLTRGHMNGPVGLYFARVLGFLQTDIQASAAATVWFPALLPFATSKSNWQSLDTGGTGDHFAHQQGSVTFGVDTGSDGIPEIMMFPGDWNGEPMPPGNFGVLQIGPNGDEITTLLGQIDMGPTFDQLAYHGGALTAGDMIQGRTGVKSSAKHAFLGNGLDYGGMLGEVRSLPIYDYAQGNGDNATFRLAGFVLVRVVSIRIDSRWRTQRQDTEGEDITGMAAQPVIDAGDLLQTRLVR